MKMKQEREYPDNKKIKNAVLIISKKTSAGYVFITGATLLHIKRRNLQPLSELKPTIKISASSVFVVCPDATRNRAGGSLFQARRIKNKEIVAATICQESKPLLIL
jgi:hypothetical protein